ncbi:MAG: hypothetical protein IT190_07610 [Microbacteriaceae bacterium]|nr:hypothetical protein [Microbacteriaceae bacterium]
MFGTSLETHPLGFGDNYVPRLWANAYSSFGSSSESGIGYNENMSNRFGLRTANYSAVTTAVGAPSILPQTVLNETTGTTYYVGPQTKLQRTAVDQTLALKVAGKQQYFEFDVDLKCEFWIVSHAASPPKLRYYWHPAAAEAGILSAATNLDAQVARGTDYSAIAAGTWNKVVTDTLVQDPAYPHPQLTIGGRNSADNANIAGLWPGGFRWLCNSDTPRGMSFDSFAFGGARISTMRAAADAAYAQFQAFGPWTAIELCFGVNDIGSEGLTIEQYKTALTDWIDYFRSSPWNQQSVPIILKSQVEVNPALASGNWNPTTHADYLLVPAVHQEIAEEYDLIVAVNERRALYEAGYDPSNAAHSTGGIHPDDAAGYWMNTRADRCWQIMQESVASQVGPTVIDIMQGFNTDATQITQQTNAATAATQSTAVPADTIAAIKADADLGTAEGGMIHSITQVPKYGDIQQFQDADSGETEVHRVSVAKI